MVDPASGRVNEQERRERGDPPLVPAGELLAGVLDVLGHRREGYRRVAACPRARLRARVATLGLEPSSYLALLRADREERVVAERLVTVTRSRFFRDHPLWDFVRAEVLARAARAWEARFWSAAAASGEEAYTLALLWLESPALADRGVRILATDLRPDLLDRARQGVYPRSALRDLPDELRARWFQPRERTFAIDPRVKRLVQTAPLDLRRDPWPREIDLLLLRNSCFTYWGERLQCEAVERAAEALRSHAWLALGAGEELPEAGRRWFEPVAGAASVFRRRH